MDDDVSSYLIMAARLVKISNQTMQQREKGRESTDESGFRRGSIR